MIYQRIRAAFSFALYQAIAQNECSDTNMYQRDVGASALAWKKIGPYNIGNASKGPTALSTVLFQPEKDQPAFLVGEFQENHVDPDRSLFISTSHQMNDTWQAWTSAPESPGRSIALAHFRAAQAAFAVHDETKCLEECRAVVEALK